MFIPGQVLEKNGKEYTVIDKFSFNKKEYILFAIGDGKIECVFYEVTKSDHEGSDLKKVTDYHLLKSLFDTFVSRR